MDDDRIKWFIDDYHQIFGRVAMIGRIEGEEYRWMEKDGGISMIPLSTLEAMDEI